MSKKKLQVEGIIDELEGASLFFTKSPPLTPKPAADLPNPKPQPEPEKPSTEPTGQSVSKPTVILDKPLDNPDNIKAIMKARTHASKQASTPSSQIYDPVETIRKAVKQLGKEVLFIRVTPEEKHEIGSIVYSFNEIYRGEGRKTSENEVGRIALRFLVQDFKENGNNSILARVIAALNA